MKARSVALAAIAAILAGTTAALTADAVSPGWLDQAVTTATNVATMTPADVKRMQPVTSDDFTHLLHIDEASTTIAPTISREVLDVRNIRKVGYGHETSIEVVTTPSGVYSSDGIASAHVLYPGIKSKPSEKSGVSMILALVGGGWRPLHLIEGGSFTHFGKNYMTTGSTTCVSGSSYQGCF